MQWSTIMAEQYIDVFYENEADQPYQVFVFEQGVVTAQCAFSHPFPVALFCQVQQMPVLSELDDIRSQLHDYNIDAQPFRAMAVGE
jgi:hypothetical protein